MQLFSHCCWFINWNGFVLVCPYEVQREQFSRTGREKCIGTEASLLGLIRTFSSSLCCFCPIPPSTSSTGPAPPLLPAPRRHCRIAALTGFMDFSSAAPASRQQRVVNIYLCIKPLQVILLNVFIEYDMQPVALQNTAAALTPTSETQRRVRALPTAQRSAGRPPPGQSPQGTRSC